MRPSRALAPRPFTTAWPARLPLPPICPALARALQNFFDHPETWVAMARDGRGFVEEKDNIVKLDPHLAALSKRLLRGVAHLQTQPLNS